MSLLIVRVKSEKNALQFIKKKHKKSRNATFLTVYKFNLGITLFAESWVNCLPLAL
jgi:hypothetical protein